MNARFPINLALLLVVWHSVSQATSLELVVEDSHLQACLEAEAKENNYKGGLRIQRGGRDKARMYVIYDEGTSGFQALAASAGANRRDMGLGF